MKLLKTVVLVIDTVIDRIGRVTMFGSLAIMLIIVYEVINRYFFSPTIWAFEMIVMTCAAYVIMCTSYGLQKGSFVCVDVLSSKFSPVTARIVMLATYFIFFIPFILGILPPAWRFALHSIRIGERSWSFWGQIVWPVRLVFFVGLLLLFIQGVSEMIKLVVWLWEYKKRGGLPKEQEAN